MKSQNPSIRSISAVQSNAIVISLSVAILMSWAAVLWSRNHSRIERDELMRQYESLRKSQLQMRGDYYASLSMLDSISGTIKEDESSLINKQLEITKLKKEIGYLFSRNDLTEVQKEQARSLISDLNVRISTLRSQISMLTASNYKVSEEKVVLMRERDQYRMLKEKLEMETNALQTKLLVASTLNAGPIRVAAFRSKGKKDIATTNALKANKFIVSFDVHNRVIEAGKTNLYIIIQDPTGDIVKTESSAGEVFVTSTESNRPFTATMPIEVKTGAVTHVDYTWKAEGNLKKGTYYIAVYHNGFKIGESAFEMKKGLLIR